MTEADAAIIASVGVFGVFDAAGSDNDNRFSEERMIRCFWAGSGPTFDGSRCMPKAKWRF